MMYYADHHGFPIITFIDTPGAFADLKSEELGQVCGHFTIILLSDTIVLVLPSIEWFALLWHREKL